MIGNTLWATFFIGLLTASLVGYAKADSDWFWMSLVVISAFMAGFEIAQAIRA